MNDHNMDNMLKEALRPDFVPSEELNRKILEGNAGKKKAKVSILPRVIAIAAGVLIVSSVGVYAGSRIYKKVHVTDHAISVGNTDYIIDEAIATMDDNEPASSIYHTDAKSYETYEEACEKSGLGYKINCDYETDYVYENLTTGPDVTFHNIYAVLKYEGGTVNVSYEIAEGNIAEDAAFSVYMSNTNNEREYITPTGNEFTLVDEITDGKTKTFVMASFDNVTGYLTFENLEEEQIHEFLDSLDIDLSAE